jgi:glycosyltransferase involved in cell wall biosynthesis
MPGEEDFGMTMVESLASGKPVIALSRGGALDIVENGCGVLYAEPMESSLEDALRSFDRVESLIDPAHLKIRASAFSESVFDRNFRAALNRCRSGDPASRSGTVDSDRVRPSISRGRLFGCPPPMLGQSD